MRPAWWARIARSVAGHPWWVDVTLAVSLAAVSVFQGLDDRTGTWRPFDRTGVALAALTALPAIVRRPAPTGAFAACCGFWFAEMALGYNPVVCTYGVLLALYTVAATRSRLRTAVCLAIGAGAWIYIGGMVAGASMVSVVLQGLVVPAVIWKVADSARAEREERARRAVGEERVRIARELHDVVAHHMSVISVQAGLARYVLRSDPDTARSALGTVLETSGEALDEMRRMLVLLRLGPEPGSGAEPAPGLGCLPDLFERVRATGVPVEARVTGEPRPLSPGAELCAYRVIQECLTNVLRHAAPATATVELAYGASQFVAVVRDDGARRQRPPGAGRAGHGLNGMRERAMLYDGTLVAGPRAEGGFEVRLELPVTSATTGDGESS